MNRKLYISLVLLTCVFSMSCQQTDQPAKVRLPAVAGSYYSANAAELRQEIKRTLEEVDPVSNSGTVIGLWAPHAGYSYSARVAAHAYKSVEGHSYDAVIVIAPSHRVYLSQAALSDFDAFRTPLGDVRMDQSLSREILKNSSQFRVNEEAHRQEHAVEVQLPFLQVVFPGVPIVPIVVGQAEFGDCHAMAETIASSSRGKQVLLVASSDMSHYPSYWDACRADRDMLEAVRSMDPVQLVKTDQLWMNNNIRNLDCTLCGLNALLVVMMASKMMGADTVEIFPYINSGDISGDKSRVVGYGAAVWIRSGSRDLNSEGGVKLETIQFTSKEKKQLLDIARLSIEAALKRENPADFSIESGPLTEKRGVFVTLTNRDDLRGCIGRFDASLPLYEVVSQMAAAAAVQDTRFAFNPVTLTELKELHIKISILSPLRKIDSIDEIKIGTHGIWIKQGIHSGTYLPEVATELGWSKEEFLSHCCREKAHLPADAWKQGAEIFIYSSQILDEPD